MSVRLTILLILVALFASSCSSNRPAITQTVTPVLQANVSPAAASPTSPSTPTPTATPHPTLPPEPSSFPVAQYTLTVELDYGAHHLTVDEQIETTNQSGEPISDLLLIVEPAQHPNVFVLNSLTWEDGTAVDGLTWDVNQLRFPLRQPLLPGESLHISLSYELNLPSPIPSPDVRPIPFGYTARQANLVDWYPFVPPYLPGIGWLAHKPWFYGEHLAYDISDFSVNITLVDNREDLTIAASAPDNIDGAWHRYRLEDARNFAWSVSPYYQVFSKDVGETTILSYAFQTDTAAGQSTLQTTVEALQLYSNLFGPYRRPILSVVQADFLEGMEYDGLYFLSKGFYNLYKGAPGEYLVAIAAHETAHQWFYAQVANDQALEPWLDEALSTYAERLYYENFHPEELDWWWTYRVNYYNPRGWVNSQIYPPPGGIQTYRDYRDAVYLNGAVFLEELRLTIGEEVFFVFLKDYFSKSLHTIATGQRFFDLLFQYTQSGPDIRPLLDKYFLDWQARYQQ